MSGEAFGVTVGTPNPQAEAALLNPDKDTADISQATGEPEYKHEQPFRIWGCSVSWLFALLLFCLGTVIGGTGQSIGLPLFEASFLGLTGVYFVLFFCAMSFNLVFWPTAFFLIYKGAIPPEQTKWNSTHQLYMATVGFFDAMNGFLTVFSASLSRVPGPMQAILLQASIPFTMFFSKLVLGKKYSTQQVVGASVVMIGIFFSLVPLFVRLHNGTASAAVASGQWYWPLLLLLGVVPGALMNIVQEKLQTRYLNETKGSSVTASAAAAGGEANSRRFSVIWFQACESLYQFMFIGIFFWFDLLPGFGTSTTVADFHTSFTFGFDCFFQTHDAMQQSPRCNYSTALGLFFIFSYILSYVFGTFLTLYASANLASIISAVPPVLTTIFWYVAPSINEWAGGPPYDHMDAGFNLGSIPFIAIGILLYRRNELGKEDKAPHTDEGPIELCF